MKRIICLMIALAVVAGSIPQAALAANTEYVLQVSRMEYIGSLSGMAENSPGWHEGMGLTGDMNAGQAEEALSALLYDEILPCLRLFEELTAEAGASLSPSALKQTEEALEELRSARGQAETCMSVIGYDRSYIYEKTVELAAGMYEKGHEAESVAYQIIARTEELEREMQTAAENYGKWQQYARTVRELLQTPDDSSVPAPVDMADPMLANIVRLKENYSADMQLLTEMTAARNQANSADITVDVVDVDHFRIYARTGGQTVLPGAEIRVWSGDGTRQYTVKANSKGYAEFSVLDLDGGADHYVDFGWEVSCSGYRTQYSEMGLHKGGCIIYADLEANDPDQDTYIAGVSFNGRDCMYDQRILYITSSNDASQNITAYIRTQSGSPASGSLAMSAVLGSGETLTMTENCDGRSSVTYTGEWCSRFAPDMGGAVTLEYSENANAVTVSTPVNVATQKAVYETPSYFPDAAMQMIMFTEGLKIEFPKDIPVLNRMSLDVNIGFPKFRAYVDVSGKWLVGATTGDQKFWNGLQEASERWKTSDTKELERYVSDLAEFTGKSTQEMEKDVRKAIADSRDTTFFGGTKAYWSVCFLVCGVNKHTETGFQCNATLLAGLTVGFKGQWTKTLFAGPFPVSFGFGFDVSAGTTIRGDAVYYTASDSGLNGIDLTRFRWKLHFGANLFGSVGVGFKCLSTGLNLLARFSATVPLVDTGGSEGTEMSFNIILSMYFKFLFFSATYKLYTGGISYSDGSWGSWRNDPVWGNAFEPYEPVQTLSDALEGDSGTVETVHEDDLDGSTEWNYSTISVGTSESQPVFATLSCTVASYKTQSTSFAFFVKDDQTVCYTNLDYNYTGTVPLPSDARSKIQSGQWKITDIGVSCSPLIQEVQIRTRVGSYTEQRQVAAVTVVCATSWTTEIQELEDGTSVETIRPTESILYTKFCTASFSNLSWLETYLSDSDRYRDLTYVMKSSHPVSNVVPLIYSMQLVSANPRGYEEWQVYAKESSGAHVIVLAYDEQDGKYIQLMDNQVDESTGYVRPRSTYRNGERPVRILTADGGNFSAAIVLTLDGQMFAVSGYRGNVIDMDVADGISDIALLPLSAPGAGGSEMALFLSVKGSGTDDGTVSNRLKVLKMSGYWGDIDTDTLSDLDVKCASKIDAGTILGEPTVYWFEDYSPKSDPGVRRTRVKGMVYAPSQNLITSPFTLGILKGNDGTAPEGYSYASDPVLSHVLASGNILMTKAWMKDNGDTAAAEEKSRYSHYQIRPEARIAPDIMGVAAQDPACSAGGSCYLDMQVINRGNVPILGFNVDVYVNDADGRTLVESVRIDLAKNGVNSVGFAADGAANEMVTESGEAAARRVPGLYDRINGDEWYVTRQRAVTASYVRTDAYGSEDDMSGIRTASVSISNSQTDGFISVPVLVPEAVQLYTFAFHVPVTWSGEKYLTLDISQVLFPEKTADIFRTAANGSSSADNGGRVLCVCREPYANGTDSCSVTDAGTIENHSFRQADTVLNSVADSAAVSSHYSFSSGSADLMFDTAELEIDYRMFRQNGADYITFTVSQTGSTDNVAFRGFKLKAYINDDEQLTYTHVYKEHPNDSRLAFSCTIPVKVLTGGNSASKLTLEVVDTVDGNCELTSSNNRHTFILNDVLRFTEEPKDTEAGTDGSAQLTVQVDGGTQPYSYQWQVLVNGEWQDVEGAVRRALTLTGLTAQDDGRMYRCVVTDGKGDTVTSGAAVITVGGNEPPRTDDVSGSTVSVYTAMSLTALTALCFIRVKKKRKNAV